MTLALTWGLEQSGRLGCEPCSETAGLRVVLVRDAVRRWVGRRSQLLLLVTVTGAQLGGPEWSCFLLFAIFSLHFCPTWTVLESPLANPSIALGKPIPELDGPSQPQTNHILQTGSLRKSWGRCPLFTPLWLEEEHVWLWQWGTAAWLSGLPALPSAPPCWLRRDRAAGIRASLCTLSQQGDVAMWGRQGDQRLHLCRWMRGRTGQPQNCHIGYLWIRGNSLPRDVARCGDGEGPREKVYAFWKNAGPQHLAHGFS